MKVNELLEAKAPAPVQKAEGIFQMSAPFAATGNDDDPQKEAAKFAKRFKVHHKMTQANGPSGGWPEFDFWGPRSNMEKFAKAYSAGNQEDGEILDDLKKSRKKYDANAFVKKVKVAEAKEDDGDVKVGKHVENIQPMRAGKAYAEFGSPAKLGDKGKVTKVNKLRDVTIVQFKNADGSVVYTHAQNLK